MDGKQWTMPTLLGLFLLISLPSSGQADDAPGAQDFSVGISQLGHIDLPWNSPKYGLRGQTSFCVFSSHGVYRITLNHQAQEGRFYLENNRFKLPIDIYFNDQAHLKGRRQLTEGVALTGLITPYKEPGCQSSSANLSIVISPQTLDSAQAGQYQGRFLLEIAPE